MEIKPPLFVDYGTQLSIGERTFINYNLTALDVAPISIGADCLIGPNVQLLPHPPTGSDGTPRQARGHHAHHDR
ncbi:hypothetical protein ACIGB6_03020 [Paeniglutamicibacter gangotriensis]|uniref:hypothetical protein n=1 Tax=Paeniglutamicibacter gangotriensis TaxID=254787 RepID=UPI0037C53732